MVSEDGRWQVASRGEPFVGRARELASIARAVDAASRSQPSLVVVEGEAGVGKSALLRAALAALPAGVRVASGVADEHDVDLSFGVLDQLLRGLGAGESAIPLGADVLAWGTALLRELGAAELAGPVALVVEDVHWSDRPSLDALSFAWRRIAADNVIVLLTARTGGSAGVPAPVERLLEDRRSHRLRLECFGSDDVIQLGRQLGKPVSPRIARALIDHTGGLPLHLRTLLEDLSPAQLSVGDPLLLPPPRSFVATIDDRLRELSPAALALVEAAAVVAVPTPLGLLARLVDVDDPHAAVTEAADAGFLQLAAPGDPAVAFVHPLLRAATYHQLTVARRSELHLRAAARARDERTSLRHRVAASLGADDALAEELAAFAVRHARQGRFEAGIRGFVAAHRVATPGPEADEYLLQAAELMVSSGAGDRAASVVADVTPGYRSPRRSYLEGVLALFDGRTGEGEQRLVEAWSECGPDDEEVAGRVASSLAALYINQGRVEDTVTWTVRARARTSPSDASPSLAITVHAMTLALLDRYDEAAAVVPELPVVVGRPHPDQVDALLARGVLSLWRGELENARADLDAVVAVARERGPAHAGSMALYYLADAELRLGMLHDAVRHGQLAVVLADGAGLGWTTAIAHAAVAGPLTLLGEWNAAAEHIAAARDATNRMRDPAATLWTSVAACRLRSAQGDETAHEELAPLWPIRDAPALVQLGVQPWLAVYVDALLLSGDRDRVEEAVAVLAARVAAAPMPGPLAVAGRATAALRSSAGDHRGAVRVLTDTAEALADAPLPVEPFEQALVALELGSALRRAGRRRAALEWLQEARRAISGLGARPWLRRCDRELAACGVVHDEPGRRAGVALTPQELAVATLVARGLTNREIAGELIVSVKTVEYHLGNLYPKLGVRSRGGVAAALDALQR